LSSAPHFRSSEWPRQDAEYMTRVYRAYRVDPYFSGNTTPDADNTARNARDRETGALTPLDQGNSPADRRTTVSIRKEVMRQEGLSINARNVKIITVNGRVTLRGPVSTEEEKRLLGEIASGVAQAGNVDNQLEVKQSPVNR
jgi:hyperosmotically inducible protein